jgi:hypothetical protein
MPLNVRQIAVSFAVISFFGIAFVAWFSGLAPFACSKRAITGALIAYLAAALAIKLINAILISAMVENEMQQQKENTSAGKD